MAIKELKDFKMDNCYRENGFTNEKSYYSIKHRK